MRNRRRSKPSGARHSVAQASPGWVIPAAITVLAEQPPARLSTAPSRRAPKPEGRHRKPASPRLREVALVAIAIFGLGLAVTSALYPTGDRTVSYLPPVSSSRSPSASVAAAAALARASATDTTGPLSPSGPRAQPPSPGAAASALALDGIPTTALAAYVEAAANVFTADPTCGLTWPLLAAIGRVESDHGRFAGAVLHQDGTSTPRIIGIALNGHGTALILDTDHGRLDGDPVYDHAVGPMQFIPSTWARDGVDGDGDAIADPFDIFDAAASAARYLCAAGGDLTTTAGQERAVLAYNHSASYVALVLSLERVYANGAGLTVPTPPSVAPTSPPPPVAPVDPGVPLATGTVGAGSTGASSTTPSPSDTPPAPSSPVEVGSTSTQPTTPPPASGTTSAAPSDTSSPPGATTSDTATGSPTDPAVSSSTDATSAPPPDSSSGTGTTS